VRYEERVERGAEVNACLESAMYYVGCTEGDESIRHDNTQCSKAK